jgi:chaperone modulatory protein CbpM
MSQPRSSRATAAGRRPARYPLTRPARIGLDGFARSAGLHPDLVRRLVALGLVRAARDGAGQLWFAQAELVTIGRIQRLRAGLGLNYAAVGVVLDLLARIDALERAARARPREVTKEW